MTSTTSIDLEFGDGIYTFALPLPQIAELQRKCDVGIGGLFGRLIKGCFTHPVTNEVHVDVKLGAFYALDIIETIRHGLIGGARGIVNGEEVKVTPQLATKLVEAYVLDQPFTASWNIAVSILGARMMGYDPPKKAPPPSEGAAPTKAKKKAGSTTA
jgi:hypothetical protein